MADYSPDAGGVFAAIFRKSENWKSFEMNAVFIFVSEESLVSEA